MFPLDHNSQGWDSAQYSVTAEDPAIKTEMDGGYMVSRPRHTRTPRKTWRQGWRSTSDSNRYILDNFWAQKQGGSNSFSWTDPASITVANPDGISYTVRFKSPIEFRYTGKGDTRLWDITVELEQV